jgi:mycofactocin precursor
MWCNSLLIFGLFGNEKSKIHCEVIYMKEIFKEAMTEIEIEDLAIDGICGVY